MAANIHRMENESGIVYPITTADAVGMPDGSGSLTKKLREIESKISAGGGGGSQPGGGGTLPGGTLTKDAVEAVLTGDITSHNHQTEIAAALANALTNYVKKVNGKGLSTNDFTTVLKQKLEGLKNYDDAAVQRSIQTINSRIDTLVGTSASSAIDTFNEIEHFLAGITDSQSLTAMLADLKREITALIPSTGNLATKSEMQMVENKIPTQTSQLNNDSNFVSDVHYVHTDNNFTTAMKQKLEDLQPGGGGAGTGASVREIEVTEGDALPSRSETVMQICLTDNIPPSELPEPTISLDPISDKAYAPTEHSGLGRVNLPKGNGILTKEQVKLGNMVYVIQYDFDLNGQTVSFGENCTLKFNGGRLKNGTVRFNNTRIHNPSNGQIFKDVSFDKNGFLSPHTNYLDCWDSDIFKSKVMLIASNLTITKDYTISDEKIFEQGRESQNGVLRIYGNGHKLTVQSTNFSQKVGMVVRKYVRCYDWNIDVLSNDNLEHVTAIFDCYNAINRDVNFNGFCRYIVNWSYDSIVKNATDSFCVFDRFKGVTSSFFLEGQYNQIEINESDMLSNGKVTDYHYDLLSTNAYMDNPTSENAYIHINNSRVYGGIELTKGVPVDSDTYEIILNTKNFKDVIVRNSKLQYFRVGSDEPNSTKGICNLLVENSTCNISQANGFFDNMDTIRYVGCTMLMINKNIFGMGPFRIKGCNSARFSSCDFLCSDDYAMSSLITTSVSDNYTAPFTLEFKDCGIDERYLVNTLVELKSKDASFTFEKIKDKVIFNSCHIIHDGETNGNPAFIACDDKIKMYLPIDGNIFFNNVNKADLGMVENANNDFSCYKQYVDSGDSSKNTYERVQYICRDKSFKKGFFLEDQYNII